MEMFDTRRLHRQRPPTFESQQFGGGGSSYQWQKSVTGRKAPQRLQLPYDMLVRGLIGQMAAPPETAVSVPLQQAISNLQSGDPSRAFGLGGGLASRLSGESVSTAPSATGAGVAGFRPGSFLPGAEGGQQGLQTREQLGLPPRESYFPFMPTKEDIEKIGLSPIRSGVKGKKGLEKRIGKLEGRIAEREAAGKPHERATKRLEKARTTLKESTGELYRR